MTPEAVLTFEKLEYDQRYYIQTAKSNITSIGQVIGEALSNSDEAITKRCERDGTPDMGEITVSYAPQDMMLTVRDDGLGMTASDMLSRLKQVGASAMEGARRGFFHRGIREVFTAMGGGEVESIGLDAAGVPTYSKTVFRQKRNGDGGV